MGTILCIMARTSFILMKR